MTDLSRMWNNEDDRKFVAYYLEKLRRGEDVFFGLIECPGGDSVVPLLKEEFSRQTDPQVRARIIEVVAHFRLRSNIPFFVETLRDPSPAVWKAALDGFFYVPCPESLSALESASASVQDKTQRTWLAEAIGQLREEVAKKKNNSSP